MSSPFSNFTVSHQEAGSRIDLILGGRFPERSRNYFQKLITSGFVLVNGEGVKKRALLEEGDEVEISFLESAAGPLEAEEIPLDILYEDDTFLAINKPPGLVVHPGAGNPNGTFANALLFHCKKLEKIGLRPGIVHRLDKETSGVLLGAKDAQTQQLLSELFADRTIQKIYYAFTCGNPGQQTISTPLGRHPIRRIEITVDEKGRPAETKIETIVTNGKLSWVKLTPKTGRTHQLRVHLKSIGCPILGDSLYGVKAMNEKYGANRQLLHAHLLAFHHPYTKEPLQIEAPFPEDIRMILHKHFPNYESSSSTR
jgi:23S rRNA pseudouridine1911/1915/1917 synthase